MQRAMNGMSGRRRRHTNRLTMMSKELLMNLFDMIGEEIQTAYTFCRQLELVIGKHAGNIVKVDDMVVAEPHQFHNLFSIVVRHAAEDLVVRSDVNRRDHVPVEVGDGAHIRQSHPVRKVADGGICIIAFDDVSRRRVVRQFPVNADERRVVSDEQDRTAVSSSLPVPP